MNLTAAANVGISRPKGKKQLYKKDYKTNDIIELVQDVVSENAKDTAGFAQMFPATVAGLKQLFDFVHASFTYVEDPAGSQWVQTPAYLWQSKRGDCKSYTVFISSILQNIRVPHLIRYVAYGTSQYRHVYPVALLDGKELPMDVVWRKQEGGAFGQEKPYTKKKDFKMEGLYKLGNTYDEAAIIGQLTQTLTEIEQATASIPNVVNAGPGDLTTKSEGELERFILADRYRILGKMEPNPQKAGQYLAAARALEKGDIAGIGSLQNDPFGQQVAQILERTAKATAPAFPPFTVHIPNPIPPGVTGLFKSVGNFIKKVGNAISDAFKTFVNWIFKGIGKKMGPFFIFQFLRKNVIKSPKIKARLQAQDKAYNFIKKAGKFDDAKLKGIMLNGILETTGKTPKQIAEEGGAPQVGALPAIVGVVIKAIGFVVEVIQKIAGLFKKGSNEAGQIDQTTMSDPSLFEEEARLQRASGASPTGEGGGGFNPLLLAAAALPAIFLLK